MQYRVLNINHSLMTAIVKAVTITVATLTLFSQDLTIIFSDALQSELTSHLLAIPFLFTYLIYRKRKILNAVMPFKDKNQPKETRHLPIIVGTLLSIVAILLYWYGSYTFTPLEYHMLSLPIFVAGLSLILFNIQTLRQLAFPIAFLIFLMPPPSEILYAVGSTLSTVSAEVSNAIVNVFGIPSEITGSEYLTPKIIVTRPDGTTFGSIVDIACSGIYSLIGFTIFAVFIAYIIRDKTWKKLALIIIGLPLIYLLNIIRITILLLLGYYYSEELAFQVFHLLGGWMLIFLGTIILLAISEKILKTQIFTIPQTTCPKCNSKDESTESFCLECGRIQKTPEIKINKKDIAKIAAIALSVTMLIAIQAPTFALTQAPTDIIPKIPNYGLITANRILDFEQKAKQDMTLECWYSPHSEQDEPICVTIEMASTRSSLHRWETCLITWPISKGYQPRVNQIELKDIKLIENPPIIGRYFAFIRSDTNETQVVLYWYETTILNINQTFQQKYVKISVIAYPDSIEDLPNIENQLTTISKTIVNNWQLIKTWSQITMIISQNGANLALATTILLIVLIIFYVYETRRQRKANINAYQKLSKPNRQLVDAIIKTEKTTIPTLSAIATTYQKITRKRVDRNELAEKLSELENTNIIKSCIANKQDEPLQIWKTQILLK
ncbi:MAG: exosortase/archaeosortase family protein [Candidatus Bathycorpusculaceae bacterium]